MIDVCNKRIKDAKEEYSKKKMQTRLIEEPKNGDRFTLHMPLLA
jgi:hypothetical protein